jgi:chromate transporter
MNFDVLLKLTETFGELSLLAIGGGSTVLPAIHARIVEDYHLLTDAQFSALFSIARAAPGASSLSLATLVGYGAQGVLGALVSTLAMLLPSSVLTLLCLEYWLNAPKGPKRDAIGQGLGAVALGLIVASAYIIARAADHGVVAYITTAVAVLVFLFTKINPLIVVGICGCMGLAGIL